MIGLEMTLAMVRVMALELWRDRAHLVMTFLLPPLVFLIFSSVFAGATGDDIKPKLAVADMARTEASGRIVKALLAGQELRAELVKPATVEAVRARVKSGQADAGLVVRADPAAPGQPFLVIADPSRAVAAPLAEARVHAALGRAVPDVAMRRAVEQALPAIGELTEDQATRVEAAAEALREEPPETLESDLFAHESLTGAKTGGGTIAYYAGAVMILFTLFSAMQGALGLMDERRSGVSDRLLAGVAGMGPVVAGKFVFLTGQGIVQALLIFATAQLVYGVDVFHRLLLCLPTTLAASMCAAGLALGLVSLCRTRQQAQMLSTFVILVLAAIGGSMVPRFLMPAWLQQVGWFTPHAWVIETYQAILWRDAGFLEVYKAWGVLTVAGLAGLALSHALARLSRR